MIKFLDLAKQYQSIKDEIDSALTDCISNTDFVGGGSASKKFEDNFSKYIDSAFCIGVGNGTDALEIAIASLELPENSEIIVPSNSFVSTAEAVVNSGHKVRFVDIDPNTYLITPEIIQENINKNTRAVIPVHLYGHPCDMDEILEVAKQHDLKVIEDCAQAAGGNYKDKKIGTIGDIGCYSFYPGKNLGACGEGGGITTNNEKYVERIHSLRNHGSKERYFHDEIGYNYRMGGLEGASLSVKLDYIESWNNKRRSIAKKYHEEIINSKVTLQVVPDYADGVHHLFVVTVEDKQAFVNHLAENNINAAYHYPIPCHLQKAYSYLGHKKGDFPKSEYLAFNCISLPMYAELTDYQVEKVIRIVNTY